MKKKLFVFFLIIFLGHFFYRVSSYRNEYFSSFDPSYWKERYLQSQWVVGDSKNPIGDDGLYAYAGWEYIQGRDPTTLNAEMPPLGKYLIGLSTLIFKNQNVFALICGILTLASFYFLNTSLFKDRFLAFLPVFLFSLEPLFYTQIRAPFLDLLQLNFLILTFLFLLKERFFLSIVFLGLTISTKASLTSFILIFTTISIFFILSDGRRKLQEFITLLPISFLVFVSTYFYSFFLGHNFVDFLKVQKWIINFYAIGAKGVLGSVWSMFLTGKWKTWWGTTEAVNEWQITWPILVTLSLTAFVFLIKNWQKKNTFALLAIWLVVYFFFLTIIPSWPRYLLLALPFMYNLSVWVLLKNIPGKSS